MRQTVINTQGFTWLDLLENESNIVMQMDSKDELVAAVFGVECVRNLNRAASSTAGLTGTANGGLVYA